MLDPLPTLSDTIPLSQVMLPTRIKNVLGLYGFETVGDIRMTSDKTLLSLPGLGPKSVAYLRAVFGGNDKPWVVAMCIVLMLAFLLILTACRDEEATGSVNVRCAEKLYSPYNPKNLEQCVAVCNSCERGTTTTCSTSCRLRGAR